MFPSLIRTVVPVLAGLALGLAARAGLDLPYGAVAEILTAVLTVAYYAVARLIESKWPGIGRILLSFGLTGRTPTYRRTKADVRQ